MDLQAQIAARRAELARQEKQARAMRAEQTAQQKVAETAERKAAVVSIAKNLSQAGVKTQGTGDKLSIVVEPVPINVDELRQSELKKLIKREARKLWTPGQNWVVISLITSGLCLIHLAGFGLIPLLLGLICRASLNKDCRIKVLELHPELLNA